VTTGAWQARLLRNGDAALDLRDDVYERYNTELDAANRRMARGAAEASSRYKNAAGRVPQACPYPLPGYRAAAQGAGPAACARAALPVHPGPRSG
jgi:4-hydroxyacetophenone monooxygenase